MRIPTPTRKSGLKVVVCGLCALSFAVLACLAQRFSFRDYSEGLGNLNINCVAQDRFGYLWEGTENGLYRYDGRQFRRYGTAEGLRARTIQSLFLGRDGTLWVGTTTGIYFERKDGSFAEVRPPAPIDQFSQRGGTVFTAMAPDQVAVADRSGGYLLRRREPEQWVAEPMRLEGKDIWSVQYGPDGVLWYGCDSDLCRLAAGKTTHMHALLHLPKDQWLHLLASRDGHIWLRGYAHLGELLPGNARFEQHNLPGRSILAPYQALAEDAQGRIAASQGPALGLWEKGHWRMVAAGNGLSRDDISALFRDREGSLWICVVGHGLRRWVGQEQWESYTTAEGLSDDTVWASLHDRRGRLWIATESGLDLVPAGQHTLRPWRAPGILTARAASLAESENGLIWMASAAGNLVRIDPDSLAGTQWKIPEAYRILADKAHRLWLATDGGLYVVNTAAGNSTPRLVEDAAFPNPKTRFTDLCLDSANRLWAASDRGLFRLDSTGWRRIDPGLSGVNPYRIAAGQHGELWAAGAFSGVMRLHIPGNRIDQAQHIAQPQLPSEQVTSLLVDRRGWVWLGQDTGVSVYDGRRWRSFTQDDGLIWNDCDGFALTEDRDGSLWIGTSGGLSHLKEPQAIPAEAPPSPSFSQAVYGASDITNGSQVPWNAAPFTISMASLSFRNERRIRFRYRLLGLETEWVESAEKSVRYPRLEPGDYRFQAVALVGQGRQDGAFSPVAEIAFRITQRWWQSWWFKAILAILAAILAALLWRWPIRHLLQQKQLLEQAVERRTHDLEREKAELVKTREQMRHFAEHDDLTGLWNHRVIIERLRQEVDRSNRDQMPLSLILVDLDHFKLVNDTHGHPAGDRVLMEISSIFLHSVRSYDWVGRYGGEEFLLILPGTSFVSARIRAEQLRLAVQAARVMHHGKAIPMTASFGVASGYPSDCESMIQATDNALYRAKNNGRNCVMAEEIPTAKSQQDL